MCNVFSAQKSRALGGAAEVMTGASGRGVGHLALELVSKPEADHERIDIHIGFHLRAERGGEVDRDIRVDPDLLDVCIEGPAARLAIEIVVEPGLQGGTNA